MATNGNGDNGDVRSKSATDYPKLLDRAEVLRDGYEARWGKQRAEMRRLLADVPEREKIMQVIERAMDTRFALLEAQSDVEKYTRLRDKQVAESTPAAA